MRRERRRDGSLLPLEGLYDEDRILRRFWAFLIGVYGCIRNDLAGRAYGGREGMEACGFGRRYEG